MCFNLIDQGGLSVRHIPHTSYLDPRSGIAVVSASRQQVLPSGVSDCRDTDGPVFNVVTGKELPDRISGSVIGNVL